MGKKITFVRGLAGIGKSTLAHKMVDHETGEVVERDHFRHHHGITNEKEITRLQREKILQHFEEGMNHVVVSDTNLNQKFYNDFVSWAKSNNLDVEEVDLRGDSPVDALFNMYTAIERDRERSERHVGERVIRNQHFNFITPLFHYKGSHDGEPVVICDLDGTLADISHRSAYDSSDNILRDDPNMLLVYFITALVEDMGVRVFFFSGRKEKARVHTVQWLNNLFPDISYDLLMRSDNDNRKDFIVKYEMFQNEIESQGLNVLAVFDDRTQVTDLWNTLGLPLYSLNKGVWF